MSHASTFETWINDTTERRKASPSLNWVLPMLIGAVVVALTGIYCRGDLWSRFWHAYLIAATYFTSISLGGLFFVVVLHLTGARWGVVLRRLGEIIAVGIGFCGVLFIPIWWTLLNGDGSLYPWNDARIVGDPSLSTYDVLIASKTKHYLNAPFFVGRSVFYFLLWFGIARYFYKRSVAQDHASDNAPMAPLRWWSGPAMLVFALSINFASMDWLMTLRPTWYSTIWGVYYFAGCAISIFAVLAVLIWWLQARDVLTNTITEEHRHDVGKLLFGFVFFWGYIAFSQFLLIWYANIPEEVQWYAVRQIDPNSTGISNATALLFTFHLIIPFLGILSRHVRRQRGILAGWGLYMLVMHWFDLYYIIAPEHAITSQRWPLGLPEVATIVGLGALYVGALLWIAAGNWLVPVRDPRLAESLAFENI
ncbi:MAG: quinol:cytochrome C oxidoreductase [Aeoliella sp.]